MNWRTGAVRPAVNLRERVGCASERRFLICDKLYRDATAGLTAPVRQQVHWKGALATEESAKKRGAATKGKLGLITLQRNSSVCYFQPRLVDPSVAKAPSG